MPPSGSGGGRSRQPPRKKRPHLTPLVGKTQRDQTIRGESRRHFPQIQQLKQRRPTAHRSKAPKRKEAALPTNLRTPLGVAPASRLVTVWGILCAAMLGLSANLYRLQVIEAASLREIAISQQVVTVKPFVPRRQIKDVQGNILALDMPVWTLYAHPRLFMQPKEEIAKQLAPVLNLPPWQIMVKFSQGESGITVAYDLAEEVGQQVANLGIDGLELTRSAKRFYPQKGLAAEVVGYVDVDRQGQAGLERSQQDLLERGLRRADGSAKTIQLKMGALTPAPVDGEFLELDELSLRLTIDSRLQRAARSALEAQLKEAKAKRGAVMVMDAKDGSLLALVCSPSYDSNRYYEYNVELFKNWVLTDLYEPGSTFKPIVVAIGLESGAIKPDSTFYDEGQITIEQWSIENHDYKSVGGRGTLSVRQILEHSSNVGMVHIADKMRPSLFYSWLVRLGLGNTVGIDLPFEVESQLRPRWEFTASPVHPATTSFGQGFAITPIQLLQLHGTLANGGYLVTPHVVKGLFDSQGQPVSTPKHPQPQQVFSPETTRTVVAMMENVIDEGTGKNAQIPGYRIAGKTGTSQKVTTNSTGYSEYARIASFVSILPADNPRYVVLTVIDEPKDGYGGTVAAPVSRAVMEALISIQAIPPSTEPTPPSPSGQE
ncbi:MAG TPA: penicillin-binding protein 2 [Oscillatoriaceae cyanobacterium M33_DOE_052]|uniref:Penicillin-binding protein 2 n=1 Tax=Planktothricoides sp. SpSt-374 TaxID=2282167 RepID=A0A7C3ZWH3_9CYAN|nr:penicillin-binding protein 2 [Oscillatoriaceae cyanobacterium M33_DOE_052]